MANNKRQKVRNEAPCVCDKCKVECNSTPGKPHRNCKHKEKGVWRNA